MPNPRIQQLDVSAYRVPTDAPEADGTLAWHQTVLVLVEARSENCVGTGYTYAGAAAGVLIEEALTKVVLESDALSPSASYVRMGQGLRNLGRSGLGWMALSAVDSALWDLKARLLGVSLSDLLGRVREEVPIYGSGGFTSYTHTQLVKQLQGWAQEGLHAVKMKVGSVPSEDPARVRTAREAIGPKVALFVDANGAYSRKQALAMAAEFSGQGVTWFEEPVSSEDLAGLDVVRNALPLGMELAAGEYGSDLESFRGLWPVVDVLQADMTRCGGVTGLLDVSALCEANHLPLSLHCGPALHASVAAALRPLRHLEFFHDHVRLERLAFEGFPRLAKGALWPDFSQPGNGLTFKHSDMARYRMELRAGAAS